MNVMLVIGSIVAVSADAFAATANDDAIDRLYRGDASGAAHGFRRAIQLQPTAAESYFNLGIALKDLSRHHDSVAAYLAALDIRPVFPAAHFNLGRSFQMLADDPGPAGYLRHGSARKQALIRAAHHFRRAIHVDSEAPADAIRSLEEVLHQLGDRRGARRAYVEFVRRSPQDGLRERRQVSCERMRELLAQEAELSRDEELDALGLPLTGESADEAHVPRPRPPRSKSFDSVAHATPLPPIALCSPLSEDLQADTEAFGIRGYAVVPSVLRPAVRQYVAAYYLRKAYEAKGGGFYRDEPSPKDREHDSLLAKDRWALDNDPLGLFLADRLAPLVETHTGQRAVPGFVKVAWYTGGSRLPPHRDQVQNLWSISLVLDASADGVSDDWPLQLIAAPTTDGSPNHQVNLTADVGSAILFAGRDFLHHRPCCLGPRKYALILLLHYVAADFPLVSCATRIGITANGELGPVHECVKRPMQASAERLQAEKTPSRVQQFTGGGDNQRSPMSVDERRKCDVSAEAWLGPVHDLVPGETMWTPPLSEHVALSTGTSGGRYLLYSPCYIAHDPDYCQGQFNNQLHFLWHAMAVARALQRTLVLPPFMWMASQDAEQHWFPASHFLDLCLLRRHQPVIELHDFVELAQRANGAVLPAYLYPPYLLTEHQARVAFTASFFTKRGLTFLGPRLISPFEEAKQATSGRGDLPYTPREARGFWRAAALHIGRHVREMANATYQMDEEAAALHRTGARQRGVGGSGQGDHIANPVISLLSRQSKELHEWKQLAEQYPDLRGDPLLSDALAAQGVLDALTFDFAPSYNFQVDCFEFDPELRAMQRASRFSPELHRLALAARQDTFGDTEPYLAVHLRRDGYEHYCKGSGLEAYQGKRFGVIVTPQMCFPSIADVGKAVNTMASRFGVRTVLLATNSVDDNELQTLRETTPYVRWTPPASLMQSHPEWLPYVELLLCSLATAFVGTLPSTYTTSILVQRDLLGKRRNSSAFFGALDFFAS